ncbi:MAG: ABC transporter permease [Treponema sp.]|nr:ABC transporter permease [Treponema sp.]
MRDNDPPRSRGLHFIFSAAGGLLLAFLLVPLLRMYAAQTPAGLAKVAASPDVRAAIGLSLEAAFLTAAIAALLGIPLAYMLSRSRFPGKGIVEALVDLPLAIPHTVVGIALLFVFGRKGLVGEPAGLLGITFWGSTAGIVICMLFVSVPYTVQSARTGFESVDPNMEKAARMLGAGPWSVFGRVSLPMARRGIFTGLMLTFARSISEFGAVIILAYYPMTAPVKIYDLFLQFGLGESSALAVIFLTVALVLFIVLRQIAGSLGTKRGRSPS